MSVADDWFRSIAPPANRNTFCTRGRGANACNSNMMMDTPSNCLLYDNAIANDDEDDDSSGGDIVEDVDVVDVGSSSGVSQSHGCLATPLTRHLSLPLSGLPAGEEPHLGVTNIEDSESSLEAEAALMQLNVVLSQASHPMRFVYFSRWWNIKY